MKKNKIFLLVILFLIIGKVNAKEASISFNGNVNMQVGTTTTIDVIINADDVINGASINYFTSENIIVENVIVGEKYTLQELEGLNYKLLSNNISSGNVALKFFVRALNFGYGYLTVNGEAIVNFENTALSSKTLALKISDTNGVWYDNGLALNEGFGQIITDEDLANYKRAETLVIATEKSLVDSDYKEAYELVNKLKATDDKILLLERLENVKFDIALKKEYSKCISEEINKPSDVSKDNSKSLIVLCGILIVGIISETIYIIYRLKKIED